MLHDALFHGFCFLDSSAKVCATRKGLEDTAGIVFMNLHTQAGLQISQDARAIHDDLRSFTVTTPAGHTLVIRKLWNIIHHKLVGTCTTSPDGCFKLGTLSNDVVTHLLAPWLQRLRDWNMCLK